MLLPHLGFWIRVIIHLFVPFQGKKQISSFGSSIIKPHFLTRYFVWCIVLCAFYLKFLKLATTTLVTHLGHFYFFGHCKNYCLELDLGHYKLLHSKFLFLIIVIYFMFHLMCILMMGAPNM